MPQAFSTRINSDLDIVTARTRARDVARSMGFGSIDQARIATAVSELARNAFLYAGGGTVDLRTVQGPRSQGLEIVCRDEGPGIEDLNLVMHDGYTTSRGMGLGLPGTRRLMDEFEILSDIGQGTTITCRKWKA